MSEDRDRRRGLPSVDRLLSHQRSLALLTRYGRASVVRHCREELDATRRSIRLGTEPPAAAVDVDAIVARLEARVEAASRSSLTRVVNASGTLLHTNLGRALLAPAAVDAIALAAAHPVNLEYRLEDGRRGARDEHVDALLRQVSSAEAATVVNNNAAAVLLCLNTIAEGREVLVSRGELVEIGGSFRIPEIMAKSGAILREVGATNRTHPSDYESAIGENTALLLKVHTSNYRIVGFSREIALAELVAIGRARGIPVMEDLGSGALVDLSAFGLPKEPVVSERIALGADVVTFSGDKALGGPQAGIIAGREALVARIVRNPLHRALRCGKLTIAGLEATLRLYAHAPDVAGAIPTLRALVRPLAEIEDLGRLSAPKVQAALGPEYRVSLEDSTSQIGSGALPTEEIPTKVLAIDHAHDGADAVARRFREAIPPIVGRIRDGRFLLDLRGIFDPDDLVPFWAHEDHGHH